MVLSTTAHHLLIVADLRGLGDAHHLDGCGNSYR
jgi:hypothetical protein